MALEKNLDGCTKENAYFENNSCSATPMVEISKWSPNQIRQVYNGPLVKKYFQVFQINSQNHTF